MLPIERGFCSRHDQRTLYSLKDVCDFHTAIAERDEINRRAEEQRHADR